MSKEYPKPVPREYQEEAATNFLAGTGNSIIQLPTGCGKTLVAAVIADRFPGRRVLFLAHTGTLIWQTCRTMLRMGLWPNVEKADEYQGGPYIPDLRERKGLFPGGYPPNEWFRFGRVWASTIQTFVDRVDKYRDDPFDLIILDESHRSLSKTFLKTVGTLVEYNPAARVLGLTATPVRGDKRSLAELFPGRVTPDGVEPNFAYRMDILDGIDRGYLVEVVPVAGVAKGIDESKWKMGKSQHGRDLTDESLAESMDNDECVESIAHEIIEKGGSRKGIVFLPGVAVAESVTAALNELEPGCATFVHGKVPKKEVKKRIRMIEDGTVRYILGADMLIEGFDVPDISLVVMARFTAQIGRMTQMLGRGLRVLAACIEGKGTAGERVAAIRASAKPDVLLLDFANSTRFKLVGIEDVLLTEKDPKAAEYVRKHRDPQDKRKVRDQLTELESLFALEEALRKAGGPPPKAAFNYHHVNLFGDGGFKQSTAPPQADARRPTSDLIAQAYDVMIDPERAEGLSHGQLWAEVERRREQKCGRKNFGFLLGACRLSKDDITGLRLNWHDATYLKKLYHSRPSKDLPDNWRELVSRFRAGRVKGVTA